MNKLNPIFHIQKLIQNAIVQTLYQRELQNRMKGWKGQASEVFPVQTRETTFESIKTYIKKSSETCSSKLSRSWV